MAPLAMAGYMAIASAVVLALMVGAIAGAIAWWIRRNLFWLGVLAALTYLAIAVLVRSSRLEAAAIVGLPPLIMTLLIAWLAAHYLHTRAKFRRISATLLGLVSALLLGYLWGFSLRLGVATAIWLALAVDLCLIVLLLFSRGGRRSAPS